MIRPNFSSKPLFVACESARSFRYLHRLSIFDISYKRSQANRKSLRYHRQSPIYYILYVQLIFLWYQSIFSYGEKKFIIFFDSFKFPSEPIASELKNKFYPNKLTTTKYNIFSQRYSNLELTKSSSSNKNHRLHTLAVCNPSEDGRHSRSKDSLAKKHHNLPFARTNDARNPNKTKPP